MDDGWSSPVNKGCGINTKFIEKRFCGLPDSSFFFFSKNISGNRDIYWVSAKIIEVLRPKEQKIRSKQ